ncbi:uncharacterized protein LOC125946509 isoform X1 [Dermacentor silvarum]|uniref:uncharacterized protein LOC125946509 isoform X1 n=1 Tax=Dermacentor silvarum TaxID=543639 RepID=UPI002101C79A|nr:uncharacterized protein LOC125946509 isoform X1 [Dermacentor silvarum]
MGQFQEAMPAEGRPPYREMKTGRGVPDPSHEDFARPGPPANPFPGVATLPYQELLPEAGELLRPWAEREQLGSRSFIQSEFYAQLTGWNAAICPYRQATCLPSPSQSCRSLIACSTVQYTDFARRWATQYRGQGGDVSTGAGWRRRGRRDRSGRAAHRRAAHRSRADEAVAVAGRHRARWRDRSGARLGHHPLLKSLREGTAHGTRGRQRCGSHASAGLRCESRKRPTTSEKELVNWAS